MNILGQESVADQYTLEFDINIKELGFWSGFLSATVQSKTHLHKYIFSLMLVRVHIENSVFQLRSYTFLCFWNFAYAVYQQIVSLSNCDQKN